uniref:Putative oxidoreductase n=1 Tax=uncultured marine microorganism TaxID=415540 RepID=A5CFV0_9ZZZZ|nr:putative oxidoreductase [uncultured marine microorganism]
MPARRLYDDDMYRFDQPQPSYWEATAGRDDLLAEPLAADSSCEVAIIGGGYTGLSTAYHLARYHNVEARVLEAGHIGWGASGRNGGFCSIGGSSLGTARQIQKYGRENVRHYYQSQVDAVELVRSIIQDENIDAQMVGDAELVVAHSDKAFSELKQHAEMQFRLLGLDTDVIPAEQYKREYFDSSEQFGAARVRPTFGLHPMRYILGLAAATEDHGARLHRDSEVVSWEKHGNEHLLRTRNATLKSKYVVMATNGFMPEHINPDFHARSLPLISAIVVTRPLTESELFAHHWQTMAPAITSRKLMNYFRMLPDNRFMFGGRGSSSGKDDAADRTYAQLIRRLRQLWPAWKDVRIDYRWHGLICMTLRQTPCIGRLPDDASVFYGFGYHGNGVNTSTWTGKQIADWLANSTLDDASAPESLPVMVRDLSGRFPLPALRRHYLQARIALFKLTDWLG